MEKEQASISKSPRSKWLLFEVIGILLVFGSLILLLFAPNSLSNLFDSIIKEVKPIVVDIFLTSEVGIAIIVSVIVGRLLERLGFTDGLIRLFVPIMKWFKINPAVIIPSVYNILGDINAAGKSLVPFLLKQMRPKPSKKLRSQQ